MADSRELLYMTAPVYANAGGVREDGSVVIKGFASVEVVDRSGDMVPPNEFRIEQFMAAPAIFVNHDYWMDGRGNRVSVGTPELLVAAKLAPNDDADLWSVVDLKTNKTVDTYPKAKVPNLGKGDRGLFVVVKVTQPEVAKMVERGELAAFSWRGLTNVDYRVRKDGTGGVERVFTDIDLYEISLVNVPDNPNSTFVAGKSAFSVRLSKSRFETPGMAAEFLKAHRLECTRVHDDGNFFHARQSSPGMIDMTKLVVAKMADGVEVVAGPIIQQKSWEANLPQSDLDRLLTLFSTEKTGMTTATTTSTSDAEKLAAEKKAADEKAAAEKAAAEKAEKELAEKKAAQEDAVKTLSKSVAEAVVTGLSPVLEGLSKSFAEMTTVVKTALTPSTATAPEPKKEEVSKSAADVALEKMNEMAAGLLKTQEDLAKMAKEVLSAKEVAEKSAKMVANATPPAGTRDEPGTSTAAKTGDKNAVFDTLLPFLAK